MISIAASLEHLGIDDIDDTSGGAQVSCEQVQEAARIVVQKYVDLTMPDLQQNNPIRYDSNIFSFPEITLTFNLVYFSKISFLFIFLSMLGCLLIVIWAISLDVNIVRRSTLPKKTYKNITERSTLTRHSKMLMS